MHFKGHTDKWCMENCNPYAHEELNQVESMWTSVCQNVEIHISVSWGERGVNDRVENLREGGIVHFVAFITVFFPNP